MMRIVSPQEKNEWIAAVLLCVAAVSAVSAGVRVAGYADGGLPDPNSITQAIAKSDSDPNSLAAWVSGTKEVADALKNSGMFAPLPPKPKPPKEVSGILGNQVLMGDKWYKVGDTMGGAKVLSIEATYVTIEWEGKKIKLAPMKASDAKGTTKKKSKPKKKKKMQAKNNDQQVEEIQEVVEQVEEDDLAWLDIPAHLKEKFRVYWDQMSDEEKEKAKEQWNNMSDDEKEQILATMEAM